MSHIAPSNEQYEQIIRLRGRLSEIQQVAEQILSQITHSLDRDCPADQFGYKLQYTPEELLSQTREVLPRLLGDLQRTL